jgi:RHS repeat-associated protein
MSSSTRYLYDGNGNKIKEIKSRYYSKMDSNETPDYLAKAYGTEYEYDALNRLSKTYSVDETGRNLIAYKEYDGRGNVTKEGNSEGYNSSEPSNSIGNTYAYDVNNNVISVISAETQNKNNKEGKSYITKKLEYNSLGKCTKETDAYNRDTIYSYYLDGNLKEKRYSDKSKENYSYDLTGDLKVEAKDRAGNTTTTYKNIFGQPDKIEYPDNTKETFTYNNLGFVTSKLDKNGYKDEYYYDNDMNLTGQKEFIKTEGEINYYKYTSVSYDETKNPLSKETTLLKTNKNGEAIENIPANDKQTYQYDLAGKLTGTYGPNGRETINQYDSEGNLSAVNRKVDSGYYAVQRYQYDVLERPTADVTLVESKDIDLSKITSAAGSLTSLMDNEYPTRIKAGTYYKYYTSGQVKAKTDANGNTTNYLYNYDNKLIKETDPMNNSASYDYDLNGNLTTKVNPNGSVANYDYDENGRVIREKKPTANGTIGITRYAYDVLGNKIKEVLPNQYDAAKDTNDLVLTMKGKSYSYDSMSRPTAAYSADGDLVQAVKYDGKGNAIKTVNGINFNGDINTSKGTTYEYDGLDKAVSKTDEMNNTIKSEYDVLGNVVKQTDARGNSASYIYNHDSTLAEVDYPDGGSIKLGYDLLGRKTSVTDQRNFTTTYTYNTFDKEKTTTDALTKSTDSKYDLTGNLTQYTDKLGNISYYSYDNDGRIASKKIPFDKDSSGSIIYSIENDSYDADGNVNARSFTGTQNPQEARVTNYKYYSNDLLDTTTDNSGSYSKNYYNADGKVIKTEQLREGSKYDIQKYSYDNQDRLLRSIKLVDSKYLDDSQNYAQNAALKDSEYPDKVQLITEYGYDILGRKTSEKQPMYFNTADDKKKAEYVTNYSYDALGRLDTQSNTVNGKDVSKTYKYDENSNKIFETNEKGHPTTYTYTKMNKIETVTDAEGGTVSFEYDKAGNNISQKDALGNSTTFEYDALNRLTKTTNANNIVSLYKVYDANGNLLKQADAKGYSAGDNDSDRYFTAYTYNLAGKVKTVTDAETYSYNKEKNANRVSNSYGYDQYGDLISKADAYGNSTKYSYNLAGKMTSVTDPEQTKTSYVYDKLGNEIYMTDGRSKVTSYQYGDFGILSNVVNADNNKTSYAYDLALNNTKKIDENGNVLRFEYDSRNLLTKRSASGISEDGRDLSQQILYSYDECGSRSFMQDKTGTSTYEYDKDQRLKKVNKNNKPYMSYDYDKNGNVKKTTDVKGFETNYDYDYLNRLKDLSYLDNGKTRAVSYSYDLNGNQQKVDYNGTASEEYSYNKNNKVLSVVNKSSSAGINDGTNTGIISSYNYTYDFDNRQTSKTDADGKTTNYEYDTLSRLKKSSSPDKTIYYDFDRSGNRTTMEEISANENGSGYTDSKTKKEVSYVKKISNYTYSDTNTLLKLSEEMYDKDGAKVLEKGTRYSYDKNGNQTEETASYVSPRQTGVSETYKGSVSGDGVVSVDNNGDQIEKTIQTTESKYDGFNRLVSADVTSGGNRTIAEYQYDGDDLRVGKTVASSDNGYKKESTEYVYDRGSLVLELNGSADSSNAANTSDSTDNSGISGNGTVKARYVKGINYVARLDDKGNSSYICYNGHGDVVETVGAENGQVENKYDYDEFGNAALTQEKYSMDIRYSGYQFDEETGSYYLKARYYDPNTARFTTEDTYTGEDDDSLSLNLYTYCSNDPVQYTDPTGHWQEGDEKLNPQAQSQILALTNAYYNASTKADKDSMHQQAEAIRNNVDNYEDTGSRNQVTTGNNSYCGNLNVVVNDYNDHILGDLIAISNKKAKGTNKSNVKQKEPNDKQFISELKFDIGKNVNYNLLKIGDTEIKIGNAEINVSNTKQTSAIKTNDTYDTVKAIAQAFDKNPSINVSKDGIVTIKIDNKDTNKSVTIKIKNNVVTINGKKVQVVPGKNQIIPIVEKISKEIGVSEKMKSTNNGKSLYQNMSLTLMHELNHALMEHYYEESKVFNEDIVKAQVAQNLNFEAWAVYVENVICLQAGMKKKYIRYDGDDFNASNSSYGAFHSGQIIPHPDVYKQTEVESGKNYDKDREKSLKKALKKIFNIK